MKSVEIWIVLYGDGEQKRLARPLLLSPAGGLGHKARGLKSECGLRDHLNGKA